MLLSRISSLISDPGVIAGLLALLTAVVGLITVWYRKRKTHHAGESVFTTGAPLTLHYVFKTLKEYRDIVAGRFDLDHEVRTEAFRDFILNYIDISGTHLYKLAELIDEKCKGTGCEGEKCQLSGMELMRYNTDMFNHIMEDYQNYYKDPSRGYSKEDREVLDYVKDLFNKYHAVGLNFIKTSIDCVPTNSKYSECSKLLQTNVFASCQAVYLNLLLGTENNLRNTNGFFMHRQFSKRVYKLPEWYKN